MFARVVVSRARTHTYYYFGMPDAIRVHRRNYDTNVARGGAVTPADISSRPSRGASINSGD